MSHQTVQNGYGGDGVPRANKKCAKCMKIKSTQEFSKDASKQDNLYSSCKTCRKAYYNGKKTQIVSKSKEYFNNNKVHITARHKQYYADNREEILKQRKQYREKNKELIYNSNEKWRKNNPDIRRAQERRRRSMKENINEKYTAKDEAITLAEFDYKCFNCERNNNLCIDHHRPLSKGFPLSLHNAVVLCVYCNSSKNNHDPEEFYGIEKCNKLDFKLKKLMKGDINNE